MHDEICTIVEGDDDTLEDYLESFLYILQRLKHKFDLRIIETLFLQGLTNNSRNNQNFLGQGDIAQNTYDQISDLCKKVSRNQSRSHKGIMRNYKNSTFGSTNVMIICLENNMDNMEIEIMNIVRKKVDSFKFQKKLIEEQETLSIYCPNCTRKHILREYVMDVKIVDNCVIRGGKHPTEEFPSIVGLKPTIEQENLESKPLHATGAKKSWPHVGIGMIPEPAPYFSCYNAQDYSY